jgi:hypothetical protein
MLLLLLFLLLLNVLLLLAILLLLLLALWLVHLHCCHLCFQPCPAILQHGRHHTTTHPMHVQQMMQWLDW